MNNEQRLTADQKLSFAKIIMLLLATALVFMIYYYDKQRDRADDLQAKKDLADSTLQKEKKMFCQKMNDTLDQYYLINKKDLELQAVIHIDTNSLDTITLKNKTEK
jgi:hypothetical protein